MSSSKASTSKNTKNETNHKGGNGNSKTNGTNGKEMTFRWLGSPYKAENRKTYFNSFEKDGVHFSQRDFVAIGKDNGFNMPSVVAIQIEECWEEQTGSKKECWFSGTPFILASLINKKSPSREVISSRLLQTLRIKSVLKKVVIQNIDTIEDLDTFTNQSDHYFFKDMKEIFNMENSVENFVRPKKRSRRYTDTTPELLFENSAKSPPKKKNGSTKKPWKRRGKDKHDDSDSSSDEERSYLRSLKRRQALELAEKRAIAEHREKIEQDYLNNSFFRNKKQPEEMDSEFKSLLEAQIVDVSKMPKEFFEETVTQQQQSQQQQQLQQKREERAREELPVPEFYTIPEDECISLNTKADTEFWKKYQAGYLTISEEEVTLLNADYETPKKSWKEFKKNAKIVNKFFDCERWSDEEAMYFKELLCAYGTNWKKISHFIQSKTPDQLEDFYKNNGYDILCQICGSTSDDARLLLCDACDKAYHTYCLKPPLKVIPKTLWFCNSTCESLYKPKCEACRKDDTINTLSCSACNRLYHTQCLVPPLDSTPAGPWSCPSCTTTDMVVDDPNATSTSTTTTSTTTTTTSTISTTSTTTSSKNKIEEEDDDDDEKEEEIIIDTKDDESATSEAVTKRVQRTCQKLSESFSYSALPFDGLKMWASRCLSVDISRIREDQISSQSDYISMFSSSVDCYDKKYTEHFTGLLQAVNQSIDMLIKNPKPPVIAKPDPSPSSSSSSSSSRRRRRSSGDSLSFEKPPKAERTPRKKKAASSDGFGEGPRAWIFQANRQIYNIEKSIRNLPTMTWFIKQHIYKIKAGDKVYIWVTGKDGGIIATASILTDPTEIPEHKGMKKYYLNGKWFDSVALRVYLKVDYILSKKLEKSQFAKNHVLKSATIMRQPIGTNFKLTKQEMEEVDKLILAKSGKLIQVEEDDASSDKVLNKLRKKTKTKSPSKTKSSEVPSAEVITTTTTTTTSEESLEVVEESDKTTPKKRRKSTSKKTSKRKSKSPKSAKSTTTTTTATEPSIVVEEKIDIMTVNSPTKSPKTIRSPNKSEVKIDMRSPIKTTEAMDIVEVKSPKTPKKSGKKEENSIENNNTDTMTTPTKSSSETKCEICLSSKNASKMLLCDACDQGFHLSCIPLPDFPDESWYCNKCLILNSKGCKVCEGTDDDDSMLLCDMCDEGYHMHCLNPPIKEVPDASWFCPNCGISPENVVAAKQILGFKEVNLSCKRILHELCEELHYKHHRNMTQYQTVDKVLKKLRQMVADLGENRSKLITAANVAYQAWKVNLSSSLKGSETEET